MPYARWLADMSLALLLAMPLLLLAGIEAPAQKHASPDAAKVITSDRVPGDGRISLLG